MIKNIVITGGSSKKDHFCNTQDDTLERKRDDFKQRPL